MKVTWICCLGFLLSPLSSLFALEHPLFYIGKKEHLAEVTPETSFADFRDPRKTTIVQFSGDWSEDCVKFWPYLYTLNQVKGDEFKIVVVDMTASWGAVDQFESEGKFRVTNAPYMAVLAPGEGSEPVEIWHNAESGWALKDYIIPSIEKNDPDFMYRFIPSVQRNWDSLFLPALQTYLHTKERAEDMGRTEDEAKRIAEQAALDVR